MEVMDKLRLLYESQSTICPFTSPFPCSSRTPDLVVRSQFIGFNIDVSLAGLSRGSGIVSEGWDRGADELDGRDWGRLW